MNNIKNKGFTLMEVLVTMGIFFILLSITYIQKPNGVKGIKFNSFVNELSVYMKELAIYGSSAGDLSDGRKVSGAGMRFALTATVPILPFYDLATFSGGVYSAGDGVYKATDQTTNEKLSYSENVKIAKICYDNPNLPDNCIYGIANAVFARPSTKAKLTVMSVGGIPITASSLFISLTFNGLSDQKCLSINSVGLVTIKDTPC